MSLLVQRDKPMTLPISPLRLGSSGPEVQNWQRFLNETTGAGLVVDGDFGMKTSQASRVWQLANALTVDGVIGSASRAIAAPRGFIQYLQARHLTSTSKGRDVDLLVIHDMEYPEVPRGAEWCAEFFAGPQAPQASAHYAIDRDLVVQCVRDVDIAWHAPGANDQGIGIEHAGYANQSRTDWLDAYSSAELAVSAKLAARLSATYRIPIVWLDAAALKTKGARGITGHRDVSLAFGGTHTDPGLNFPIDEYLRLIRSSS